MPKLSLILPVLDEENIIEKVVADIISILTKIPLDYEIILVENGSKDKTLEVIKKLEKKNKRIKVVITQKGYGSSVLKGLEAASGEYVSYMPSDGQIDNEILPVLYKEIQTGKYDLVKIKRSNRENLIRLIRSKVFNILARLIFPITVSDINGSPRIFKKDKLSILDLRYKDSFIDTEFAVKASLLNWKIQEIPMKNLERVGGKYTVSINTVFEFLHNLYNFRFSHELDSWKKKNLV